MAQFTIDVVRTSRVQVRLQAKDEADAHRAAKELAEANGYTSNQDVATTIASWPADEPEEMETDLGNGYRVRRGWFWEVNLDHRTVCFLPDRVDPLDLGVTAESFSGLIDANETIFNRSKRYGWAAAQGGMSTWSKLHDNPKDALKSCRRFVEGIKARTADRQRFEREQAERESLEAIDNAALLRMVQHGGQLYRDVGGQWKTPQAPEGESPEWFVRKDVIDRLVAANCVHITDRMNRTGDPRAVALMVEGLHRAQELLQIPEALR